MNHNETQVVVSPGAREVAWAIKVKSLVSYNTYKVSVVELGLPGTLPIEFGDDMEAVNLAESFLQEGTLPAGAYGIMIKSSNIAFFYAKP